MSDAMMIALEAAWELDPVRLEDKLWKKIDSESQVCYNPSEKIKEVEQMSNVNA